MASHRDKETGRIYLLRKRIEDQFDQEFEAEQRLLRTRPIEQMMTCEDEDANVTPDNATIADVMKMLNTVARKIEQLAGKQDTFRKQVSEAKHRVLKLEAKLNSTLSMTEKVKDTLMPKGMATEVIPPEPGFEFRAVSNEQELNDLDHRLATDNAYRRNLTNWLNAMILNSDSDRRLYEAMEVVFTREFLPLCSWKGRLNRKIAMCTQTHIMELFRVVGSSRFTSISAAFVAKFFQKKLPHAKTRLSQKSYRPHECNKKSRVCDANSDPLAE
uniref:DUF4806 domain-containing protein n=1 Tax=Anopheles quadriannulatus TaxID=34691 RepID=A0A1I8JW87_ANOQN